MNHDVVFILGCKRLCLFSECKSEIEVYHGLRNIQGVTGKSLLKKILDYSTFLNSTCILVTDFKSVTL